ncbi:MATE efflux family protein [Dorea sp. 5-2]|jgi:putative MATE family efflux protein|nr:MATE efflux family protein [Dorea sp. 5-2]MCI9025776.1 MATE family efflux transporter [Dorea sp.]MDE6830228.1 MATE family efflux transporter [Lachnospiraceae bacterium]
MAARIKNMTEGRPASLIFSFALPLMVGNVFQQLYTVVDTMVVGKALGVGALAALGAADWLNWMMLGIIQGLTQGFAILMAQEFGAGRYHDLRKSVGNSAVLSLLSAICLLVAGQILARPVLMFLKTPPEILENALLYLRIMYIGVPIVMAYNLLACILRSLGDGKTPLHAMVVAAVTNIVLDLIFVLIFRWGIAGAAAATLIAQLVSSVFCLYHIGKIELLRFTAEDFRFQDRRLPLRLFMLGLPMAFQNAIISVGGMIVQSVVNGFGVIFIAGFTATNKLYGVLEVAATSYGYSMVTYAGQNLGAGNTKRIRKGVRSAVVIALFTSLIIACLMLLGGRSILGCFISGTPKEASQTLQIAYYYLTVMSICLPVLYILHITRSAIQGMGNTVLPLVSGIAEFIMRASTAVFLPMLIGETGIFYAEIMAWTGATVILIISYFAVIRKMEKIYGNKDD